MILRGATIQYKGYDPDILSKGSHKRVCVSCDECGKVRWIPKQGYHDLCIICANKLCGKDHPLSKPKIILICKQCKNEYKVYFCHQLTSKFCSNKCKGKWMHINQFGENHPSWKGGLKQDQKYCNLWTEEFRESIRDQFHNKCYLCGITQDRKLSVHHVNYNKSCLCGSSCEFVPLCGSCHGKTNGNRKYWEDLIMCMLYPNRYFMPNF